MSLGDSGITGIVVWKRYLLVVGIRLAVFLIYGGVSGEMDGAGGGMGVLGIHLVNSSRILEVDINCLWWLVVGAPLISKKRKLGAWMNI